MEDRMENAGFGSPAPWRRHRRSSHAAITRAPPIGRDEAGSAVISVTWAHPRRNRNALGMHTHTPSACPCALCPPSRSRCSSRRSVLVHTRVCTSRHRPRDTRTCMQRYAKKKHETKTQRDAHTHTHGCLSVRGRARLSVCFFAESNDHSPRFFLLFLLFPAPPFPPMP